VIDRSLRPINGSITVCYVDGQFTLKKMTVSDGCVYLIPANRNMKPIKVTEGENFIVWGVVTYVIKKV
ncbi:MAG: S24 family peptidase, partial [Bacteroidota bacterium]